MSFIRGHYHEKIWRYQSVKPVRSYVIHQRALSWEDLKKPVSKTRLKITFLESHSDLPGANELNYTNKWPLWSSPWNIHMAFVVLCLLWLYYGFLVDSYHPFSHILQGYFTGTGAIMLPQCQWSNPEGYGLSQPVGKSKKLQNKYIILGRYWILCSMQCMVFLRCDAIMHCQGIQ